jgi:hypothetical protein
MIGLWMSEAEPAIFIHFVSILNNLILQLLPCYVLPVMLTFTLVALIYITFCVILSFPGTGNSEVKEIRTTLKRRLDLKLWSGFSWWRMRSWHHNYYICRGISGTTFFGKNMSWWQIIEYVLEKMTLHNSRRTKSWHYNRWMSEENATTFGQKNLIITALPKYPAKNLITGIIPRTLHNRSSDSKICWISIFMQLSGL